MWMTLIEVVGSALLAAMAVVTVLAVMTGWALASVELWRPPEEGGDW